MIFLIFSSIEFLLWFLPIFLIVYGITPRKYRNLTLLVGSIVFYARGDVRYLPLLMISILCNYFLGLHLAKRSPKTLWRKKLLLILTLGANLAVLLWFKDWGGSAGLPLGISFYTFLLISGGVTLLVHLRRRSAATPPQAGQNREPRGNTGQAAA